MPSDTIRNATEQASDTLNKAAETGADAMKAAGEYADKGLDHVGNLGDQISDFARRDPWLALIGAVTIGYIAAHFFKRS